MVKERLTTSCIHAAWVGFLALGISIGVHAQTASEGNNAVYSNSSGTISPSTAYIDAYPVYNSVQGNSDICVTINYILTSSAFNYAQNYPSGAVIDGRGILPLQGGLARISCSEDPFYNNTTKSYVAVPSTILLPGETIAITAKWVLPSNTRIIGEGSGPQNYTALGVFGTFTDSAMIQMGPDLPGSATGVVVEHLQLNGGGAGAFDGIDNVSAGDGSYVDDVDVSNIGATSSNVTATSTVCTPTGSTVTSLCIGPQATYSGPYTNLNIVPPVSCSSMCNTAAVKIQAQTRGLHNITVVEGSNAGSWPAAAIYLDSYGTSIENVHVEGFQDAIVVGDNADGQGGVQVGSSGVLTVTGNTITTVTGANGTGPVRNAVHICNKSLTSFTGACSSNSFPVNNLTILHALGAGTVSLPVTPVQDDNLQQSVSTSTGIGYVALYVVGASNTNSGYSRFTTGPGNSGGAATATWGVGSTNLGTATSCTNSGAIYSNTAGTSGSKNTIFVCSGGFWSGIGI